jgi:hypothetical protein
MTPDRVALLVVHGIADQLPGQTAREVARLLCHRGDGSPRYVQGEIQQVMIPVEKLEPGAANPPRSAARPTPGTPSGFYQAQRAPAAEADPQSPDLGIALNDYLLGRLVIPERDALYESTRVSLRRRADNRALDVYEMYWADLSRLGTGGIRALSSLYQLFFHLSTLAADVVDQAALGRAGGAGWRVLQRLHGWLAWLMKGPAAVFQLAMLLMVVFGAAALVAPELQAQLLAAVFGLGSFVLVSLTVLTWLRKPRGIARAARLALLIAAAAASLATAIVAASSEDLMPTLYFGASAVGAGLLGAWLVERYSGVTLGVRLLGHIVVVATVVLLCVDGQWQLPYVTTQQEWMLVAALNVGEWLLAGVLLVWTALVTVQTVALSLGLWLGRGADDATRASLATARVALVGSSGLFVVLSLVLWSVIGVVTTNALNDLLYEPVVFGEGYRSAAIFLDERVKSLGAFFTPLVVAFTLLGAAALLVLLPSLIEEVSPASNLDANGARKGTAEWARNLGRWLTGGLRVLQKVSTDVVPVGAIGGSAFFLAFVLEQFALTAGLGGDVVARLAGYLAIFEGETLVAAGKWLAGGALTIVALGSRFTQTIGRLRVAIDAVLDIDNYFADPPNRQPPRARIYSRYVSVLAYLREAGYTRIVIVAHSQGTVISADLLRYLHVHRRLAGVAGNMRLALVTVGSPLRDLYAAYFPLLYQWMGSRAAGFEKAEPAAADLGVTEWVNACRSGDYVGRFVWTTDRDPRYFDVARVSRDGTVEARRAGDRTEFCLGAGGHTHYFGADAVALAAEIERLAGC